MVVVVVAILGMIVVGLPVALALDGDARGGFLLGVAYLYGSGCVFLSLLILSILHIRWSVFAVSIPLFAIATIAGYLRRQAATVAEPWSGRVEVHSLVDAVTLVMVIGYAMYCTLAALWEWDFWAIWGLKGRVFFDARTIDWPFLESVWNRFTHPDYPLLVPFNYGFAALLNGAWDDRWLGLLSVGWGVSALLIVRGLARRESRPLIASCVTLAIATVALSRYVGMAEGPLIAFGGCGILLVRRAVLFDDEAALRHGALLLGFAASCKNEGLALVAGVLVTLAWLAPRKILRLWPAVAIPLPWLILRAAHKLPTDLATGSILPRVVDHIVHWPDVAYTLIDDLVDPWGWMLLLITLLVVPVMLRRRERFVLGVTVIQFGFYVLTYLITPNEVKWHILTSWPRLTRHLSFAITYAAMMLLANFFDRGEDAQHAEARSEH